MNLVLSQDSNNPSDLCGHIENFLSDKEIADFYSHQTKSFIPAGTRYRGKNLKIRDCDKLSGATVPEWLRHKLGRAIDLYNNKTYKFDLYPILSSKHEFNIVRYKKAGQHFTAHKDCRPFLEHIHRRRTMRKISISVQLTDGYTGGDLEVAESFNQRDILGTSTKTPPNNFRHKFKTMKKKGSLTIFTAFHLHQSTPLKTGLRDVLVCFIRGESQVW